MSLQTLRPVGDTPDLRMKRNSNYNRVSYEAALSNDEHDILILPPGHPEPRALSGMENQVM